MQNRLVWHDALQNTGKNNIIGLVSSIFVQYVHATTVFAEKKIEVVVVVVVVVVEVVVVVVVVVIVIVIVVVIVIVTVIVLIMVIK